MSIADINTKLHQTKSDIRYFKERFSAKITILYTNHRTIVDHLENKLEPIFSHLEITNTENGLGNSCNNNKEFK